MSKAGTNLPLAEFNRMTGQSEDNYSGVFSIEELPYEPGELAGVKDLKNMTNAMDELMTPMIMVVVGMTVAAVVISVIIIFLLTSLIIEENRASISLFKVFGYRGKEVKKLILGGSGPVVVAGFLLGVPVMLASANALYAYLGEMINLALPMVLSPLYVLISFVLIYGVYELTKLLCGRKLREIPILVKTKRGLISQDRLIENQEKILTWLKQINSALGAAGNTLSSATYQANK